MPSLDFDEPVFPGNVVMIIATFIELLDDALNVLMRPLRLADPNFSVGIFPVLWTPTPNSAEMRGREGLSAASLQRYQINIQALVKNENAEQGIAGHSVLSEAIRTMLDDSEDLRLELGGLSATVGGQTKYLKRWWPVNTRFLSGELKGTQLYLSLNELIIEVEKK